MARCKLLSPLADVLFPPRCPLCGAGTASVDSLCAACWTTLAIPGDPCCSQCQRPFAEGMATGAICAPCLQQPPTHDGIAAGSIYTDPSRRLVLALKHGHRIGLAPMMARLISARLREVDESWVFVPVPLHRWRLWQRGFNQSALIARALVRLRGGRLCVDGLVRRKRTPSLAGLGRKARKRALSGAITINPRRMETIRGANIVLVDDVLTSGATTNACVSMLKRAGAGKVVIACFARVIDEVVSTRTASVA